MKLENPITTMPTMMTAQAVLVDENVHRIPSERQQESLHNYQPSAPRMEELPATTNKRNANVIPSSTATTPAYYTTATIHTPPPPNAPPGGVWGQQHFRGRWTTAATVGGFLVAHLPGLLLLFFRLDRRDAYLAPNGNLYDAQGTYLGRATERKFVADKEQKKPTVLLLTPAVAIPAVLPKP